MSTHKTTAADHHDKANADISVASWTDVATQGINHHHMNPCFFLPRAATIEPEAPAIHHRAADNGIVRRTYQEFADRVRGLAYYCKLHNYKRVAILSPNTPGHIESMFGAVASGGVTIGLNYRLTATEIAYKIQIGEADLVIADFEFAHLLTPENAKFHILINQDLSDLTKSKGECSYTQAIYEGLEWDKKEKKGGWDGLQAEGEDENATMGLYYTSGTTGRPKAVAYSHRGLYLATLGHLIESQLNCQTPFGENRCRYLWTLPMFHASGWTYPYGVTAVRGTHICLRNIDVDYIWDILTSVGVTHYCAAPTVNILILQSSKAQPLSKPVLVTVAASPPSGTLFKQMLAHNLLPIHTYGLTETYGPFTRLNFLESWNKKSEQEKQNALTRQGHAFITSSKLRVVRQNDYTQDVTPDGKEIGEIIIRGNFVAQGYYKDPKANSEAFVDGWFHSGDLAVIHPDGTAQILDRKKDIIISGGENISTVVVENAIMQYEGVLEVSVIGVPDETYGERPKAFVTLKSPGSQFDGEELKLWLRKRLGGFQIPNEVVVVESLPKTSTGKIKKHVLKTLEQKSKL